MDKIKKMNFLRVIILVVVALGIQAVAQNFGDSQYWDQLKEMQQKTRQRLYPGGSDESDLKVQTQLNTPERKVNPVQETQSESHTTD